MTTMIIDNKATAKKSMEKYIIDRNEYKTIEDIRMSMQDMINDDTYLVRVYEGSKLIIEQRA